MELNKIQKKLFGRISTVAALGWGMWYLSDISFELLQESLLSGIIIGALVTGLIMEYLYQEKYATRIIESNYRLQMLTPLAELKINYVIVKAPEYYGTQGHYFGEDMIIQKRTPIALVIYGKRYSIGSHITNDISLANLKDLSVRDPELLGDHRRAHPNKWSATLRHRFDAHYPPLVLITHNARHKDGTDATLPDPRPKIIVYSRADSPPSNTRNVAR